MMEKKDPLAWKHGVNEFADYWKQRAEEQRLGTKFSEMLARISMRNFAIPMTLQPYVSRGVTGIVIRMTVPDRESGIPRELAFSTGLPRAFFDGVAQEDEEIFFRFVHQQIYNAMRHEIDEAFHVNGKRIFDPHAGIMPLG